MSAWVRCTSCSLLSYSPFSVVDLLRISPDHSSPPSTYTPCLGCILQTVFPGSNVLRPSQMQGGGWRLLWPPKPGFPWVVSQQASFQRRLPYPISTRGNKLREACPRPHSWQAAKQGLNQGCPRTCVLSSTPLVPDLPCSLIAIVSSAVSMHHLY